MDREKLREAAQRLAERGQFDLALVEYGRLIASDPNDTRALLVSGDLQVRTGDFAAAIATYDTVARLYAEHGYADKAVAVYHQVRQLLTQHRTDLLPQYAHVLAHLLALLHDLGRPNDALALLDEEANRLRAAGAELEAIDIYRRMTELAAGTPLPYLRLAEALCRTGNVDEALEAFWVAAEFLLSADRRDDALRVIERMLHFKQDPKYARIAAELYLEKGEVPEAMQALSRLHICFQADATDLKTLALLAKAFLLINQEDKAIEVQKELARQAHEQGDKELFRATVAELHTRAPSDDQVHALSELPPPPEDKAKRRAPPKRPAPSEVAAAVDSIPAEASPQRPSSPGRPPRSRVGTPLRATGSRVPGVTGRAAPTAVTWWGRADAGRRAGRVGVGVGLLLCRTGHRPGPPGCVPARHVSVGRRDGLVLHCAIIAHERTYRRRRRTIVDGYEANTYGDRFADVYDDWYQDVSDVASTVARVAALAGPGGGRVLELGAGSGRLAIPLAERGLDPGTVTVQTDRGGEFSGGKRKKHDQGFVHSVRKRSGARHVFTPPRWPNANADVEAVHRLIEEEFFDLEGFSGRADFLRKVTLYQHYFNFARPNSYKADRTPWEVVSQDLPDARPAAPGRNTPPAANAIASA